MVVASLVLLYVRDWAPLMGELARCLKPGGSLVASTQHPITAWLLSDRADYHRTEVVSDTWDFDGVKVNVNSYRRPMSAIFGSLRSAGFLIDRVVEPRISAGAGIDPDLLDDLTTQPFFLYLRAIRADT